MPEYESQMKQKNVAVFGNLNVRKYHVDIDDIRHPKDCVSTDYTINDYVDQHRDLKLFYKECVREEVLSLFVSFSDMKKKYPIQVIDLRFQVDYNNPMKIQLFEEYNGATNNARLFMILFRVREGKMISDGNTLAEVNIIKNCQYLIWKNLWENVIWKK